jgi:hypothetical protein
MACEGFSGRSGAELEPGARGETAWKVQLKLLLVGL